MDRYNATGAAWRRRRRLPLALWDTTATGLVGDPQTVDELSVVDQMQMRRYVQRYAITGTDDEMPGRRQAHHLDSARIVRSLLDSEDLGLAEITLDSENAGWSELMDFFQKGGRLRFCRFSGHIKPDGRKYVLGPFLPSFS